MLRHTARATQASPVSVSGQHSLVHNPADGLYDANDTGTRNAQYEMAFRMQSSVPGLADLSDEPESTYKLYGEDARRPGTFGFNCLMARRLAERDVRFIQLYHSGWDHHFNLPAHLPKRCKETDQASAALILDVKQRGLLEDTIVVWGGEFGRTTFSQDGQVKESYGRDHHANCFTTLVAGGASSRGSSTVKPTTSATR